MRRRRRSTLAAALGFLVATAEAAPRFNVLAIAQLKDANGDPEIHAPFVKAANAWLDQLAADSNFAVTHVESPDALSDSLLARYQVVLQLNYIPFHWKASAQAAFERYITQGKGGWVGLHHAGLYGPEVTPASEKLWTWYYGFLGKINYKNYIASFASATVRVEEKSHPVFQGVPASFGVSTDEWYTWDKSPRPNVHVLANVDENSYQPASGIKMGDHPVAWSNEAFAARNLYIFMGHHPNLFQNAAYVTLLRNAIFWAGAAAPVTASASGRAGEGALSRGDERDAAGRRIHHQRGEKACRSSSVLFVPSR